MGELIVRFILGGVIVTAFAVIGKLVHPKSLSGIFEAAPSVALATLGLAFVTKGGGYAATEGRSMIIGSIALGVYSFLVGWLILSARAKPIIVAPVCWAAWLVVALGLGALFLR